MVDLMANTIGGDLFPKTVSGVRLSLVRTQYITGLSLRFAADGAALKALHGVAFPPPNRCSGTAKVRCLWVGLNKALLIGPKPDKALGKAIICVDQSDAYFVVRLEGERARDVLARLTPIDLRGDVFKRGHTARTELRHMQVSISRTGACTYEILGPRSMLQTLAAEVFEAMRSVAAQPPA